VIPKAEADLMSDTTPDANESTQKPQLSCGKCGTVLSTDKDVYWHERRDSAGCIRALIGMVLDLHERLETIEKAFVTAAAKSTEPPPSDSPPTS
jgi:hypothetical protein